MVKRDWGAYEPLGDLHRLFPIGIDEPDHTEEPVVEGFRMEWVDGERVFVVHSSGQWRSSGRRGDLAPHALRAWSDAIAALRGAQDAFRDYVDYEAASGRVELATVDDWDVARFDAANVPEALRPLQAIFDRWLALLADGQDEATSPEFERVRST